MEMTINQRYELVIEKLSKNATEFARKINRPTATIASIVSGRSKPGAEILADTLEAYPQIDALWLVSGKGEMQKDLVITTNEKIDELYQFVVRENEILLRNNQELLKNQERLWNLVESNNFNGKKLRPVPVEQNAEKGRIIFFYPEITGKIFA